MGLKTNSSSYFLLDVGGTFIKACVVTCNGVLIEGSEFTIPIQSDGSRDQIEGAITSAVRRGVELCGSYGVMLAGIGIAAPGPFDYEHGVSLMQHKFQSIYGVSLADMIHAMPEIASDLPIKFLHDVVAVLLGEMSHGNGVGYSNVAVITLGTGLGFSFCRNGVVDMSPTGSPRVPIYNLPYGDGILEDYVSKRGFLRIYSEMLGKPVGGELTVADIGRMAGEGYGVALKTFQQVGEILGDVIAPIVEEYEIECLMLGGQISKSFVFMEDSLRNKLADRHYPIRVGAVKNIGSAPFYGLYGYLIEG